MRFLIRTLVTALALWIATLVVSGIHVTGEGAARNTLTLIAVAMIFGVVNAILKPLIKIFGCAFYILTLGLFAFVVNAFLFWFTSWLAEQFSLPFHVDGFWAAFWGAIIVTVVSWLINLALPEPQEPQAAA